MTRPAPGRSDPLAPFRARCGSCRADILWAKSAASGKSIPINTKPSQTHGNVVIYIDPDGDEPRLVATVLTRGQREGAQVDGKTLYTSHFSDCPNANGHRRRYRRP